MTSADVMFSYRRFVCMSQTNVPVVLLDPDINGTASLPNVNLIILAGMLYTPGDFSPRSSFTFRRKLAVFPGGRPTYMILCLKSLRLMLLKVVLTNGRRATEVGFSGVVATFFGG
jgi:hypothetical protein